MTRAKAFDVSAGEDEALILVGGPKRQTTFRLVRAVSAKRLNRHIRKRDHPPPSSRLGLLEGQSILGLLDRLTDRERCFFQIDVAPADSEEFAASEARRDGEYDGQLEAGPTHRLEESLDIFRLFCEFFGFAAVSIR